MLEENEGSYYLEFFSQGLVRNAVLALLLAPIVPGWIAQYGLIGAVVFAAIFCLTYPFVRKKLLKMSTEGPVNSTTTVLISEEAQTMFRVTGTTTVILLVALMWLGFAGMIWLLDSFFVLFVTLHVATAIGSTLMELAYLRGDLDDITNSFHGTQPSDHADDGE